MDIEELLYRLKIKIVTNLNIKEADRLELGNDIFEIEKQVKSTLAPVSLDEPSEATVCKHYKDCNHQERYKEHCSVKGIHRCYEAN